MKTACALAALLPLLLSPSLRAQDETPALPDEQPALTTERLEPVRPATPVEQARSGTTVIGDAEAPIGLYIMPWRQSQAQDGLDRPARLLDEALLPLDPDVFKRQVEYHRALSAHLQKNGRATP